MFIPYFNERDGMGRLFHYVIFLQKLKIKILNKFIFCEN